MAISTLLDTNAYSALRRDHPAVVTRVRDAESILLSTIVIGEVLFGFRNGTKFQKNLEELESFLAESFVHVFRVSELTSDRYSRIALGLRKKGTPIPTNDIWIAAHTMESGAELLSYDEHFENVEGLVWTHLHA